MKKIGLITLSLLCAVDVAMADSMEKEATAEQTETAVAPAKAAAHHRMARHGMRRLPSGDLRHCLDLKTDASIIRCSESRRRR